MSSLDGWAFSFGVLPTVVLQGLVAAVRVAGPLAAGPRRCPSCRGLGRVGSWTTGRASCPGLSSADGPCFLLCPIHSFGLVHPAGLWSRGQGGNALRSMILC